MYSELILPIAVVFTWDRQEVSSFQTLSVLLFKFFCVFLCSASSVRRQHAPHHVPGQKLADSRDRGGWHGHHQGAWKRQRGGQAGVRDRAHAVLRDGRKGKAAV